MNQPAPELLLEALNTPQAIAARLQFSAQLLSQLALAIEANALALPASKNTTELRATAPRLAQIACVHQRLATSIKKTSKTGSRRQPEATFGSIPEAQNHA